MASALVREHANLGCNVIWNSFNVQAMDIKPGLCETDMRKDLQLWLTALYYQFSVSQSFTHRAKPFLRSCQLCSYSRTSQHFMEPKGSLLCSQYSPLALS
jgi:hypothetical protein